MEHNTEMKFPSNLLEELAMRRAAVANAQKFIDEETEKYKKTIRDAEIFKEREEREIESLKDYKISFSAESLVEEIAKEWNSALSDLNVEVNFYDTERIGRIGRNKFIELCERDDLYIEMVVSTKNVSHHFYSAIKVNLLDFQKDGRRLKACLDVESKIKNGLLRTDFTSLDYRNLIFKQRFRNLFDTKADECTPINENCELMYKAYERDIKKKNAETLNV